MNARDIIKLAAQQEIRNEVTMLKVERSIKTSFTEESNQLFLNYKGYQYNLFPR